MALELVDERLDGLKLFVPKVYEDKRGWFYESWRSDELNKHGIDVDFVQDNHSLSQKNVIRGMHFQHSPPQGKLVRVSSGAAQVVEVDIRVNSQTFGKWESFSLSADNKRILWVPPGFANGFLALEDNTEVQYKVTNYWSPKGELNIRYDDPEIGIEWKTSNPITSERDKQAMSITDWKRDGFRF
jgi:dTDP-4-dehydrorhamnose 3,5-epimerase